MKLRLKHHVVLDGKAMAPGVHEIPGALSDHWFLKGIVKKGHAEVLEESPQLSLDPFFGESEEISGESKEEMPTDLPAVEIPAKDEAVLGDENLVKPVEAPSFHSKKKKRH